MCTGSVPRGYGRSHFIDLFLSHLWDAEVMPMVYAALDSELPLVLERALKLIPGLCATLDYTTVKQILFPKVTMVFTKTTLLSVKVRAWLMIELLR